MCNSPRSLPKYADGEVRLILFCGFERLFLSSVSCEVWTWKVHVNEAGDPLRDPDPTPLLSYSGRHALPRSQVHGAPKKMANWDAGMSRAQACQHGGESHRETMCADPRVGEAAGERAREAGVAGAPRPSVWTLGSNAQELVCCGPYHAEPGWGVWMLI